MSCKNCGGEVDLKLLETKKRKLQELEEKCYELSQEIAAMEAGYCGTYCQDNAEDIE